ncbi:hypothetical protein [Pseudoalteromonas sp. McH1-42]|uniref:hypothetical protein n=1 Tax=Pseudoalteromonas sp. McH1-42 TaxID=2917752 RepID=UPI001EF3FCE9|nr:hypothetical protein [Pseudoalteromonas sp. McH1-42]MCG7564630.1 hypothetical protein [Pseudoalteromonas sp. McH1-42]
MTTTQSPCEFTGGCLLKIKLNEIVESIIEVYDEKGEKYFKDYGVKENALKLLSQDEPSVWIHSPFHATRAKKALGLAYILNRENLESLYAKKKSFLEEQKDFGLMSFNSFYSSLKSASYMDTDPKP